METSSTFPEATNQLSTSELLESLATCSQRLGECLERDDWQSAGVEVENRRQLLELLASRLSRETGYQDQEDILSTRRKIKWLLEDIYAANEKYLQLLKAPISSWQDQIKELKKGRKALGLYKVPDTRRPRFLNRIG